MSAAERVLAVARAEIGYREKASNARLDDKTANAGTGNWTKYARDLDSLGIYDGRKNGYAWCDVFADWCFIRAFGVEKALEITCQPMKGYGAGCTESRRYYREKGRFFAAGPEPGDQIFFTGDGGRTCCHTGLVEKVEGSRVYTIEGNTSGGAGVEANGGCVCRKSYALGYSRIAGYGRPAYEKIGEDEEEMDVKRFKELWLEMRREWQDNDSSAYSEQARQWAVDSGLIQGGGRTAAGDSNYLWEDVMTREQLVTVLYRFAVMAGLA